MGYRIDLFDPKHTALIVVDMMEDFIAPGAPLESPAGRAMVPTLNQATRFCRDHQMPVLFTAHAHRADGSDMGLYADLYPPVAARAALIEDTPGVELYADVERNSDELLICKHRYSAFFGTDLEIVLRGKDIENVVVAGVTSEDCVHATARDAMFRNFKTAVLSDASATYDHPDIGQGAMAAEDVHSATLVVLAQSTADVMSVEEFMGRVKV